MKNCKWNGGWTSFHVQCKKDNNGVKEGWLLRGDELCVCCEREYCLFWNYKSRFDSRMGFVGRMQRMAGGWSEWSLEAVWCLLFQCVRSRNNKNSSGGSAVALPPKCSSMARRYSADRRNGWPAMPVTLGRGCQTREERIKHPFGFLLCRIIAIMWNDVSKAYV